MTDGVKRRFSLQWQSMGHAQVQGEADRVDASLDAVAKGAAEVTRRSDAQSKSMRGLGQELGSTERRLDALDRTHSPWPVWPGLALIRDQSRAPPTRRIR